MLSVILLYHNKLEIISNILLHDFSRYLKWVFDIRDETNDYSSQCLFNGFRMDKYYETFELISHLDGRSTIISNICSYKSDDWYLFAKLKIAQDAGGLFGEGPGFFGSFEPLKNYTTA